jgi:hypothetical protein
MGVDRVLGRVDDQSWNGYGREFGATGQACGIGLCVGG